MRSQIVTSRWGGRRYAPYAFTEQGIAMLSSVLSSKRAMQVNITIMRTFTRIRSMLASYEELKTRLNEMDKKYAKQFTIVFEVLEKMLNEEIMPKRKIGFIQKE